jgi:hypothetical protein
VNVETLIRKALDKGVELRVVDGKVKLCGKRGAMQEFIEPSRQHRDLLLRWLQASQMQSKPETGAWKDLAAAYHAHHFNCPVCIGAGQGRGLRCGTGTALWSACQSKETNK